MRFLLIAIFLLSFSGSAQVYNRLMILKFGYTSEQLDHRNTIIGYNDSSNHEFNMVWQMPSIAYSHEFVLGNVLSLTGTVGWQYMNITYDAKQYGSQFFFASVNPKLSIFQRKRFEYYMKLKVGITVWTHKSSLLADETRRLFPERVNLTTGITFGGFNFFLNDNWGLNAELSIFSPEMVTLGVTYRFFRGDLPKMQGRTEDE